MKRVGTLFLVLIFMNWSAGFVCSEGFLSIDGRQNSMRFKKSRDFMPKTRTESQPEATPREKGSPGSGYEVGVDDVLDISIIKPQAIKSTVTVAPDGAINFVYIGNVYVEGLTLPKVQEEIQQRLADGYMEFPIVSVSLRKMRSKKFIIYGQVVRPGAYPVEENLTLLSAITVAGGFIVPGSTGRVKLLRPRKGNSKPEVTEFDVTAILSGINPNVPVLPGDTIVVSVDKFNVYGEVNRPGAYPVEENLTLLRALTVAGGSNVSGSTGRVKLLRSKTGNKKFEVVESDITSILNGAYQNVFVLPGDTVVVSVDKFLVYGQVNRPGAYPVEENMTLLHAITVAGGFIESGSTGRVKLFRPKPKSSEFEIIESDITSVLSGAYHDVTVLSGDTIVVSADKFFISGQVNRPGAYPVEEHMTLLHAITAAGGFIEPGSTGKVKLLRLKGENKESKIIELDAMAILSGDNQNVSVLPGDTIIVSADKFFVYGEVAHPGRYPLEASTTPLTAIAMAGGFTKFGSASRVKVLRMSKKFGKYYDPISINIKDVISGYSKADALLKPGDIVVVSEGAF